MVQALAVVPSGRDFASEFVMSLAITSNRLYRKRGMEPLSLDLLLEGVSMSAGDHPALYEHLKETVMPKVATVLRHVASVDDGTH